jgi:hypothetical protein
MIAVLVLALATQTNVVDDGDARDTLLIMNPVVATADASLRNKLSSALAREAAKEPRVRVFSSSDIAQLADLAAQQQLAACDSDACVTEIGDAMGARYVLFSTVQRVGRERQLEVRLLDAHSGDIVARAAATAHDTAGVLAVADDVTREVLRTPFPPPPAYTRPLVIGGVVAVGVGVIGAAAAGFAAFQFDGVVRNAASSGADKEQATALGPLCIAGAIAGGAVALSGALLIALGAAP